MTSTPARPDPSSRARRQASLRLGLIIAIIAVVGVSVHLYRRIGGRRTVIERNQAHPEARAEQAMRRADRAIVRADLAAADREFRDAAVALDLALAEAPERLELRRARVTLCDRLAQVALRREQPRVAAAYLKDAVERSSRIFADARTDDRNRSDRLSTAHQLAQVRVALGDVPGALAVLEGALADVEPTLETLAPSVMVRQGIADGWLAVARAQARLDKPEMMRNAYNRALAHARTIADQSDDPNSAVADLYALVGEAAAAMEAHGRRDDAIALEQRALELLELRNRLTPGDAPILRALSGRYVEAAERAIERQAFDEATGLYEQALEIRRARLARVPEESQAIMDVIVALTHIGRLASRRDRNEEALKAYGEAAVRARQLGPEGRSTRARALGSQSQVLGRMDRMIEAKRAADDAFELALALAQEKPDDRRAGMDAVAAGLRHARLLRASPRPNRKAARRVAREARNRLRGLASPPSTRASKLAGALDELLAELRP